ncbi:Fc.00g075060.m01.CDS01 [Cosmosporella sp. VM-42]
MEEPPGAKPAAAPQLHAQQFAELTLQTLASADAVTKHEHSSLILEDQAARVAAKEEAVSQALGGLRRIRSKFTDSDAKPSDLQFDDWLSLLHQVEKDDKEFEYLTGVAGDTGMGKTSLLNALVGKGEDLAPSSQNGACTAAVCCFHYHEPDDKSQQFFAKVQFKSKDAVDQELMAFFLEYKEKGDDELDGEVQAEKEQLEEQLGLIHSWSGLDRSVILDLGRDDNAAEITTQCVKGSDFFNYEDPERNIRYDFSSSTARQFYQIIRPYVGHTNQRGKKAPLLWPLVEIIHIYVNAPILRCGISLVDLPGENDSLDSRSKVARNYYNKLDRLMIVTPCDRAADNATAANLLRDDQFADLEADGKIDEDSVCVVVTKIDAMVWTDFAGKEWQEAEISEGFPQLRNNLDNKSEELDGLAEQIEALKDQVGDNTDDQPDDKELSALRNQHQNLEVEVKRLNEQCLRECIEARNHDIVKTLRERIAKVREDLLLKVKKAAAPPLSVFPVSSTAHRNLSRRKPQPAFPDPASTGFQDLEDWIVRGSLPKREQHADGILMRCQRLFDGIEGWAIDQWHVKLRLPEEQYSAIEKILKTKEDVLKLELKKIGTNLGNHMRGLGKPDVAAGQNSRSMDGFTQHIQMYQYPKGPSSGKMHWSTYAACIRRNGGLFKTSKKPRTTYCWRAKTYLYYWRPHVVSWSEAYNQKLPAYIKNRVYGAGQAKADEHMQKLLSLPSIPEEYKDAFKLYIYKIENITQALQVSIQKSVNDFRAETREIRQKSGEVINEHLTQGYNAAKAISGKGRTIKQIAAMKKHADSVKKQLFENVAAHISQNMKGAHKSLFKTIGKHCAETAKDILKVELSVAKHVCSGGKKAKKPPSSAMVEDLKNSVKNDIDEWNQIYLELRAKLPVVQYDPTGDEDNVDIKEDEPETKGKKRVFKKESCSDDEMPLAKVARMTKAGTVRKKPGPKPNEPSKTAAPASVAQENDAATDSIMAAGEIVPPTTKD